MSELFQIFYMDGRPRAEANGIRLRTNTVRGRILGARYTNCAATSGLKLVDIVLTESPNPNVARSITAFVKGTA